MSPTITKRPFPLQHFRFGNCQRAYNHLLVAWLSFFSLTSSLPLRIESWASNVCLRSDLRVRNTQNTHAFMNRLECNFAPKANNKKSFEFLCLELFLFVFFEITPSSSGPLAFLHCLYSSLVHFNIFRHYDTVYDRRLMSSSSSSSSNCLTVKIFTIIRGHSQLFIVICVPLLSHKHTHTKACHVHYHFVIQIAIQPTHSITTGYSQCSHRTATQNAQELEMCVAFFFGRKFDFMVSGGSGWFSLHLLHLLFFCVCASISLTHTIRNHFSRVF